MIGEFVAPAEIWDPATETSGPAGSDSERWGHAATLLPDGRVLVVGGFYAEPMTAEVWDPATSTFSPAGKNRIRLIEATSTAVLPR